MTIFSPLTVVMAVTDITMENMDIAFTADMVTADTDTEAMVTADMDTVTVMVMRREKRKLPVVMP